MMSFATDNGHTGATSGRTAGGVGIGRGRCRASSVVSLRNPCYGIATWNVRTMLQIGKLENVRREMERNNIQLLGLSETRWRGVCDFTSNGIRIIHSDSERGQGDVALIMNMAFSGALISAETIENRIIMARFAATPVNVVVIQCYMPTSNTDDELVEDIYTKLEQLIQQAEADDNIVIMGDWNACVGEGRDGHIVGPFGLGKRNTRGQRLVDFCLQEGLVVTNTWSSTPLRRRYTWKAPGDRMRMQIDYILVKKRYRNQIKKSMAYPGADVNSDHNLVKATTELKLRKQRQRIKRHKWDLERLREPEKQNELAKAVTRLCGVQNPSEDLNELWLQTKSVLLTATQEVLGYQQRRPKNRWMTQEILEMMDEKRKFKSDVTDAGKEKYRRLKNDITRECRKAKEKWWSEQCNELEELDQRGRADLLHNKIKGLGRIPMAMQPQLRREDGTEVNSPEQRSVVWRDYIEGLYRAQSAAPGENALLMQDAVTRETANSTVLREEFMAAMRSLPNHKCTGIDEIPAEVLKNGGAELHDRLYDVVSKIYNTGKWPDDMYTSVIVPIPKKAFAKECRDYRTISMVSHASKILLHILKRRLEGYVEAYLDDTQCGFRKNLSTRDAIATLRNMGERMRGMNRTMYVCYIDYEKAFDRVEWTHLFPLLEKIGVPAQMRILLHDLYTNQKAIVRLRECDTEPVKIARGVRQGCLLSPSLFNVFAEMIVNEALQESKGGITIGGRTIKTIKFADDQALLAGSPASLSRMLSKLNRVVAKYGMKININKTKVMCISRQPRPFQIKLDGELLQQVSSFVYLGQRIEEDASCHREISARIAMAKHAFVQRRALITQRSLSISVRKRIVKAYVWAVALYGAETWTITKADRKKLEAFEAWCWRRLLRVSWTEHMTNNEIFRRVREDRTLLNDIRKRRLSWIGHVLRHGGMLQEVLEGRVQGKRPRGRPRYTYVDTLKREAGIPEYSELKRATQDRCRWKNIIRGADQSSED